VARRETAFRRDVVKYAKDRLWYVHWEVDHKFKVSTGFPDLVLAKLAVPPQTILHYELDELLELAGSKAKIARVLFRELKLDDTYLKPEQDDWRILLTRAGLDWAEWRPRDWPQIIEELE
jgi:hypothetical protein